MNTSKILLGNEAIAHGILAAGAGLMAAYPGTPSSEICEAVFGLVREHNLPVHVEWSVNEKTAFEVAYAHALTGRRSAVAMKQVGLNVASDPVMSAAYMGTAGGMLIIVADDPGPHSSQTEQDTRLFSLFAKLPVLDPSSPAEALRMVKEGFELSEKYHTPVILRPTTRVCHARQLVEIPAFDTMAPAPDFQRNPARWAATPGPRLALHRELNAKIDTLAAHDMAKPRLIMGSGSEKTAIVAAGVAYAYLLDVLSENTRWTDVCLYKVDMPYPMDQAGLGLLADKHQTVLVMEETEPVIELQFPNRTHVRGRMDKTLPLEGELNPEIVMSILDTVTGAAEPAAVHPASKGRKPSLCAGCSHRSAFYGVKRALPKGIYTSDIGCYTLGLNLGVVDTCLCMGAAVSQAAGFYHAYKNTETPPPIAAIIGDSTYFHAGIPPTINALVTGARFVLVILDNATTAMTGHQPTPATGGMTNDYGGRTLALENVLQGCGVKTVIIHDPYDVSGFIKAVKTAYAATEQEGVCAVIARRPCIRDSRVLAAQKKFSMRISEECNLCGYCVREFECPALIPGEGIMTIDPSTCIGCGVCAHICPRHAIIAG